jgi:hypothetical protein
MDIREIFHYNERWLDIFSHIAVCVMMICLGVSFVQFIHALLSGWSVNYIPWLFGILSLESMHSYRATKKMPSISKEWLIYRGTELVVIFLVVRAIIYLAYDPAIFFKDISLKPVDFLISFLNSQVVLIFLMTLFCWWMSGSFAGDLIELESDEINLTLTSMEGYSSNRAAVHRGMVARVLTVGAIILVISGMTRIDLRGLGIKLFPKMGVVHVIVYFIFGLALLSQSHFASLRAIWGLEHIPITKDMSSRWITYSLIFLITVSVISLLLPTRYTIGLLPTINYLLDFIIAILMFLMALLVAPLIYLLSLLLRFIGFTQTINTAVVPQIPKLVPPSPTGVATPWSEMLKSILFWAIFISIIGFALYQYVGQNQKLLKFLRRIPGWNWLARAWHWMSERIRGLSPGIKSVLQNGLRRLRLNRLASLNNERWRFLNLRKLSPRQRVLFFYLAFVRRGGEIGMTRQPTHTPYEYSKLLKSEITDVSSDVDTLTNAFVEARYSKHEISPEKASLVQRFWEHIRRAMHDWRKARLPHNQTKK